MFTPLCLLQINLRLILVSGKTKEFLFSPSESAGDIAQHVFDNWPEGKVDIKYYLSVICIWHRKGVVIVFDVKESVRFCGISMATV